MQSPTKTNGAAGASSSRVVADDPAFLDTLVLQFTAAAEQLDQLALELGKPALGLTLDDLISARRSQLPWLTWPSKGLPGGRDIDRVVLPSSLHFINAGDA